LVFIIRRGPNKIEGIPFHVKRPRLRKVSGWYLSHPDSDCKRYGGELLSPVTISRHGAYRGA